MSDDIGPGSAPWLTRFREINSPTQDLVSVDGEGNPVPEAVCGTLTWFMFAVGNDDDGDPTEGALVCKFAPIGEMDPAQAMHLHMKVVTPSEAVTLMLQLMECMLPDDLHSAIRTMILTALEGKI